MKDSKISSEIDKHLCAAVGNLRMAINVGGRGGNIPMKSLDKIAENYKSIEFTIIEIRRFKNEE